MEIAVEIPSKKDVKKKDDFCSIYSILAFLHKSRVNPNKVHNYIIDRNGYTADDIDLTNDLKVDEFEKLDEKTKLL